MLECRACFWRCLRAICPELAQTTSGHRFNQSFLRTRTRGVLHVSSRHASSLSVRAKEGGTRPENSIIKAVKNHSRSSDDVSPAITDAQLRRLKLELPWFGGDRVKLLERTRKLLKDNRPAEAYELAKLASKDIECTVIWNALLEHQLAQNKINEAFKMYNDMKKRAQIPDSYTYSTLFIGLAATTNRSAGKRAVQLWQSLTNPNSKVKPSILLTNAALKACANSDDMDALWSIAGAIPESGAQAANSITYTTIINAMRFNTQIKRGSNATEQEQQNLKTAVTQTRQIWRDVIARWTSARLTLDEDLVCAMGRLLSASQQPQDWDDVFSLIEQTMNIPREEPQLALKSRPHKHNPNETYELPAPFGRSDRTIDAAATEIAEPAGTDLGPIVKKGIWIHPTNQTLTLLIETCQKMFLARAAGRYWRSLTDPTGPHAIKPDSPSFHAYLRMLRQSRASTEALRIVRDEMQKVLPAAKTFRIAMSACVKNQFSPHAMREATQIMDLMLNRYRSIDPKTGTAYMNLSLNSPHVQDTFVALNYFTPQRTKLWDIIKDQRQASAHEYLDLAKAVTSGFDRVLGTDLVSGKTKRDDYQKRKAVWTHAVQRLIHDGERIQPMRSDEEIVLIAKKNALQRFERKHRREATRAKRGNSRALAPMEAGDGLPVLESDGL